MYGKKTGNGKMRGKKRPVKLMITVDGSVTLHETWMAIEVQVYIV